MRDVEKESAEYQELITDFFKDESDTVFILFISRFVYHNSEDVAEFIQTLFDRFLEENGLTKSFNDYEFDISENRGSFLKCSMSARNIIVSLQHVCLSVAYHRFKFATVKLNRLNEKIRDGKLGK